MRVLVTADLHYHSPRSRGPAEELAAEAVRAGGDALVLVGDSASAAHEPLRDCLGLFADFPGRKFMVPGNHCLWCLDGEDSIERYERTVPAIAAEAGFAVLDHGPAVIDGVGLVGSVGWYDYSYRQEDLGIPLAFYEAKVAPGAAARLGEHRHLVDRHRDELAEEHFDIGVRWNDGVHVRMDMTDAEFLARVVARLRGQLAALAADASVREVAAFVHHLPFRHLLPVDRPPAFAFAAAYLGSDRIGEALRACPKLTRAFCGHSHWPGRCEVGGIQAVNVGSTYTEKRMEIVDL